MAKVCGLLNALVPYFNNLSHIYTRHFRAVTKHITYQCVDYQETCRKCQKLNVVMSMVQNVNQQKYIRTAVTNTEEHIPVNPKNTADL